MRSAVHHDDPAFATTLAHGLTVLQCFRAGEPILSNKDLAERTGLSKATISRLTYTLAIRGLLMYDAQLRRYRLGSTVLSLSYPLLASLKIRQLARPFMKQLADYADGSVSLGMRDRLQMIYVETSRGHDAIAFRPDIGACLPLLASAMGRAWLAQAPESVACPILEALRRTQAEQWRRHAPAWKRAQRDYAEGGYCLSHGDWQADVHAVAVPLRKSINGDCLVFNCGVPTVRLKEGQLETRIAPRLLDLVARVETLLADSP